MGLLVKPNKSSKPLHIKLIDKFNDFKLKKHKKNKTKKLIKAPL